MLRDTCGVDATLAYVRLAGWRTGDCWLVLAAVDCTWSADAVKRRPSGFAFTPTNINVLRFRPRAPIGMPIGVANDTFGVSPLSKCRSSAKLRRIFAFGNSEMPASLIFFAKLQTTTKIRKIYQYNRVNTFGT